MSSARSSRAAGHLATERGRRVLAALDDIATAHGATPTAIALAWLRTQPTITSPIASARTPEQLQALLESTTITLTPDESTTLANASSRQ